MEIAVSGSFQIVTFQICDLRRLIKSHIFHIILKISSIFPGQG